MIPFQYLALVQVSSTGAITDEWVFADASPHGGGAYTLVQYAPTVAPRRRSRLGGSGDWADVVDSLTVHVLGGTAAQAVDNYDRLIRALDIASRWEGDEGAEVIQIRAQVQQSTVGELAAVVLGPEGDGPPASPDPTFDEQAGQWAIRDVTLTFRRRGLWLRPTAETFFDGLAFTNVGEVATVAMAPSHPTLSPARVNLTFAPNGAVTNAGAGYFLIASDPAQFVIINAAGFPLAPTNTVAVAEAAGNYSRSGNILRFTCASASATATTRSDGIVGANLTSLSGRYGTAHVFVNVRPASAAAQWDVQALHADSSGVQAATWVGRRIAAPQSTVPQVLYLGAMSRVERWRSLIIQARCPSAPSYPQTLDMDTMVVMGDDDTASILALFSSFTPASVLWNIAADPLALSATRPRVAERDRSTDVFSFPLNYAGDGYTQQRGATLAALLYTTPASGTAWRLNAASAAAQIQVGAVRHRGWRVPQ